MEKKLLSSLGIEGNEAKIYNALLKLQKGTPAVLAKMTGIKRTTAYHTARILVEKGLFVEDLTKRPITFSLASPEIIQEVIKREKEAFLKKEKSLSKLAGELSRITASENYTVPEIRFVEEEKIEAFLFREKMKWHHSLMKIDATWWGFQDHTFIDNYGNTTAWYWKKVKDSVWVKLLSNKSETERRMEGKYTQRQIKFWNKTKGFLSTTWIIGDYMIIINTCKHPFYLVEIHDKTLANDQREIFKNLWDSIG